MVWTWENYLDNGSEHPSLNQNWLQTFLKKRRMFGTWDLRPKKMLRVCCNAVPQLVYCIIIYIMFPSFNFISSPPHSPPSSFKIAELTNYENNTKKKQVSRCFCCIVLGVKIQIQILFWILHLVYQRQDHSSWFHFKEICCN